MYRSAGVMKQLFLFSFIVFLAGCGSNSEPGIAKTELDGETGSEANNPGLGINLDELKQSPLFRDFHVDLLSTDPIEETSTFSLSSNDTYKISLKTLDFLSEPKRYTLVKATNIVEKGLPKVIAPLGYKVTLMVQDNQVIAEIQSTTEPKDPPKHVPIIIKNDDIIVGDITASQLQASVMQKDLAFSESIRGLTTCLHGLNRYITYHTGSSFTQVSQQQMGKKILVSAQTGVTHSNMHLGCVSLSIQGIYRFNDAAFANVVMCKYSCGAEGLGQWHAMASCSMNADNSVALGIGWTGKLNADSKLSVGVVKSETEVSLNVFLTLNP